MTREDNASSQSIQEQETNTIVTVDMNGVIVDVEILDILIFLSDANQKIFSTLSPLFQLFPNIVK